jgi:DNA ligase (NAD+)
LAWSFGRKGGNSMKNNDEIKRLEAALDNADQLYHTFGDSGMSDDQYDSLKDLLKKLDPKNKRFSKVGAKPDNKHWEKYDHGEFKMGSQNKINTEVELIDWCSKYKGPWIVQEKLDGMSIKLIYYNGKLLNCVTRGDGETGEDITRNCIKMKGIKTSISIKKKIIIRGEIILHNSVLEKIGGKIARNVGTGIAKRLDGTQSEYLDIHVYDIMNWKETDFKTHSSCIAFLNSEGFNTVSSSVFSSASDIQKHMDVYHTEKRKNLDWCIDGLVVKCDNLAEDEWKHPKRQIAYKFKSQKAATKLLNVEWNESGGRITPVGILEPVEIDGVTISRATLNNIAHIEKLGIKINDIVEVSRRNDVIPCIEGVLIESEDRKDIIRPTKDSEGYDIVFEKNSMGEELVFLVSTNPNSRSKIVRQIMNWLKTHDTKGVAEATVEAILDSKIASDLPTFFEVCMNGDDRLLNIDGFGKGTFKILKAAALKTSHTDLVKFFTALDFNGFGEKSFTSILDSLNRKLDWKELFSIIKEEANVNRIEGFGENSAKSMANEAKRLYPLAEKMASRIKIDDYVPMEKVKTKISGLKFCFTGEMSRPREKMVKSAGGIIAGVSKNLDFLVTEDPNSGSGKNKKADEYGIKKISERELINMLEGK